jgi:dephospho-CoA kinase
MKGDSIVIVGLTGGVASGKSLVSGELKRLGAHIIDADVISREIVEPGEPAYREIASVFGKGVLRADGTIDRRALGGIVFSDPGKLKILNEITHPRIIEKIGSAIKALQAKGGDPLIVVDAALLIEVGLHKEMSKVIVVYADEEKQVQRIISRDHLIEKEARERINAQMPLREKLRYADFVIDNNGRVEDTLKSVKELYGRLAGT